MTVSESRKLTINDIARLAKVSKKTVSRVINNSPLVRPETRERILAIVEDNDFVPNAQARALAFRRSFLVAMIYDNPSPQYVVNMQHGILDALEDTNYQLVVRPCDRQAADFYDDMRNFVQRQRVFGAILPPSVSEDDELVELLRTLSCPYVRIASVSLDEPKSMLETHDKLGAGEAARYIAGLGHRRIAHISGPATFKSSHERELGFRRGLEEVGVNLDSRLVKESGYTFESGFAAAKQLLRRKRRPTAVFAGNDEMAVGVYQAAREAGLSVPGDLSVVGFDDSPMASRVWPQLTSVRLPIRHMGEMAARMLVSKEDPAAMAPPGAISVFPKLVVRESAGPPA